MWALPLFCVRDCSGKPTASPNRDLIYFWNLIEASEDLERKARPRVSVFDFTLEEQINACLGERPNKN